MEISTISTEDQETDHKICLICKKQYAKYTCPKCNIGYCSLPCYKNHSDSCTRSFYQDNVVEHLKSQKVSDDEKMKMFKALKRLEEENSTDIVAEMMQADSDSDDEYTEEDEEEISIARLQNLNLDSTDMDTILAMMTPAQRKEFEESVKQGKIGNWLDVWAPWWDSDDNQSLITPITSATTEEEMEDSIKAKKEKTIMPKIEENLPKLTSLTAHPPSPMLAFNLLEILFAYGYVLRLYNGDWSSDAVDAASIFSSLASSISSNSVHSSCVSALQDVVRRSLLSPISSTSEVSISIILDVSKIVEKKTFVLASLSDIRSLLQVAETTITKQETAQSTSKTPTKKGGKSDTKKQIALQTKKIYFYLVWANEQDPQKFEQLSEKAFAEWDTQITILKQSSDTTKTTSATKEVKKPVIEEI